MMRDFSLRTSPTLMERSTNGKIPERNSRNACPMQDLTQAVVRIVPIRRCALRVASTTSTVIST